jgi:hypothetical protein
MEDLSKQMYADQRNLQPTQGRPVMFRTKAKKQAAPAQPVKTGLFKTKKQPPPPPTKTGLMSKVKALFSSRKEMTAATPKVK